MAKKAPPRHVCADCHAPVAPTAVWPSVWMCPQCGTCSKSEIRLVGPGDVDLEQPLRRFVFSGLDDADKGPLRNAGLIDYSHGSWSLSNTGKAEAIRLGYL